MIRTHFWLGAEGQDVLSLDEHHARSFDACDVVWVATPQMLRRVVIIRAVNAAGPVIVVGSGAPCPAGTHDFDFSTWTCRKCGSGIQMINAPQHPTSQGAVPEPRKLTQRELDLHRAVGRMRALG